MFESSFQRGLWWARALLLRYVQVLLLIICCETVDLSDPVHGLCPRVVLLLGRSSISRMHTIAAALHALLLSIFAEATTQYSTLIQMLSGR
jgi:hypothetical protein